MLQVTHALCNGRCVMPTRTAQLDSLGRIARDVRYLRNFVTSILGVHEAVSSPTCRNVPCCHLLLQQQQCQLKAGQRCLDTLQTMC
jgi:hypothetical protein